VSSFPAREEQMHIDPEVLVRGMMLLGGLEIG
jgi:hypothetical protein